MTASNIGLPEDPIKTKLPRRDWILLPALSLLTICVIVVSTNLVSLRFFTGLYGSGENCIVFSDPSTGARGIPNSVCREQIPESEVTEYRFNSCGHRTDLQCETKPPGTYRIVMIGGSYAMGMRVPNEKTIAKLLPSELSQKAGRTVELYNQGMPWRPPRVIALHFNEVLAVKPDMILWILTPSDIWDPLLPLTPSSPPRARFRSLSPYRKMKRIPGAALDLVRDYWSRVTDMFQHFLYESQSQSITSYLDQKPDAPYAQKIHGPEFLRVDPSAEWQAHLREISSDAANIEAQARAAGVPLVAVFLPERPQAAMISKGEWPAGYDPYRLDNQLRSIVVSNGEIYIDILPSFRNIPNTEQGFFPLDGHPNTRGHALISGLLATELANAVPALRVSAAQKTASEKGR